MPPEFTPAVETLLRTIAQQGESGAAFKWETGGYYRLEGTDYRVARRTFFPLTGGGYVEENQDDTAPMKLTDKGRKWMADHPVPRGSRGPYVPRRSARSRTVARARAVQRSRSAHGFTAEIVERTVVISCPDNDRGGATLPADGWEQRAMDAHPTLHNVEGPLVSGAYALRWREDPRTDAELLRQSLDIVTSEPARQA
ncbi:hypothetical protein ABZ468_08055 [Streptomyces sp. NPDC005708]|uniref:hypothetical protein n=1 Tax=Streptomyces sp. NPDC005708 TaxID=3154564 RepID=UPI0033F7847A